MGCHVSSNFIQVESQSAFLSANQKLLATNQGNARFGQNLVTTPPPLHGYDHDFSHLVTDIMLRRIMDMISCRLRRRIG